MTTVAGIANQAFTSVKLSIPDAISDCIINSETASIVFEREKTPIGYAMPTAEQRIESAWIEGLTTAPQEGNMLTSGGVIYYILSVLDLMKAGSFYNVALAAENQLLWVEVAIQEQVRTADGAGGSTMTWQNVTGLGAVKSGWALLSATEQFAHDRRESVASWRVLVEHNADINATQAILYDGRRYNIATVTDQQKRGTWMVLDVDEGQNVIGGS